MAGRFDVALLFRPGDPWSGALVAAAGIAVRVGFAHPFTLPYLTCSLPAPQGKHAAQQGLSLVSEALRLLGHMDESPSSCSVPGQELVVSELDGEMEAETILSQVGAREQERPVVLHPGSGWPIKNWPPERWAALARELHQRQGVQVFVTGGLGEDELMRAVESGSGGCAHPAGPLSIRGLAALYRRSSMVIATDSGPLHLAALCGARVVGIYGPADPAEHSPWALAEKTRVIAASLPCRPCRTLESPACKALNNPPCLTDITVEQVLQMALSFPS